MAEYSENEAGRFEIFEAGGKAFRIDTATGDTWILRHVDSKPVWVIVSERGPRDPEQGT